jgi:mRNA-degrading endonuclease RelE of RelBE toxin-antitoxin system
MDFGLKWSPDARDHLAGLAAHQRATAVDGAQRHLRDRPMQPSKKRKLLTDHPIATWELRLGNLRVFYNIDLDGKAVEIVAIGVKERNRLLIGGEEIEL